MELNSRELRIGNLVYYRIEDKLDERKEWNEVTEIHALDLQNINKYYSPIPISEDWLIKAGFVENKYEYSIPISDCGLVTLTLIPHDEQHSAFSVCVSQTDGNDVENVFLEEISFWHELQNLYKSISGKELNFTP
jgi:hypothetical protein